MRQSFQTHTVNHDNVVGLILQWAKNNIVGLIQRKKGEGGRRKEKRRKGGWPWYSNAIFFPGIHTSSWTLLFSHKTWGWKNSSTICSFSEKISLMYFVNNLQLSDNRDNKWSSPLRRLLTNLREVRRIPRYFRETELERAIQTTKMLSQLVASLDGLQLRLLAHEYFFQTCDWETLYQSSFDFRANFFSKLSSRRRTLLGSFQVDGGANPNRSVSHVTVGYKV